MNVTDSITYMVSVVMLLTKPGKLYRIHHQFNSLRFDLYLKNY